MFSCCSQPHTGEQVDLPQMTENRETAMRENPEALMSLPFAELASAPEAAKVVVFLTEASELEIAMPRCSNGGVGVTTSLWPVGLQVIGLGDSGQPAQLDSSQQPELMLYDFIIAVGTTNLRAGPEAMQRALSARGPHNTVTLKVVRPARRTVTLQKEAKVGLKLGYQAEAMCLRVKEVVDGAAMELNDSLAAGTMDHLVGSVEGVQCSVKQAQIQVNDFILSINGTTGVAETLCQAMRDAAALEMVMLRLPAGSD